MDLPVFIDDAFIFLGHLSSTESRHNTLLFPQSSITDATEVRSIFGDPLDGPHGLLTTSGQLYDLVSRPDHSGSVCVEHKGNASSPTLSHIEVAGNGHTAIIMLQAQDSNMIHILEFADYTAFDKWYANPYSAVENGEEKPFEHHTVGGRAATLVGGATSFVLLTEEGTVFSWGDGRHPRCLGRTPGTEGPATKPGFVETLGGIKIERIDGCGWVFGALSASGDLYLWGREKPGIDDAVLDHLLDDEVKLLEGKMFEDIKDFAVGNGHIVVASAGGEIFATGENRNGQLGVDNGDEAVSTKWRQVVSADQEELLGVVAGDLTSFVIYRQQPRTIP